MSTNGTPDYQFVTDRETKTSAGLVHVMQKKCCSLDTSGTFPQCHRFVILEALHF